MSELVAFESAARHGSFTRAATELALAQSAVSRHIQSLERKLSVVLFERARKRVTITGTGRLYHVKIRDMLAELVDLSQQVAPVSEAILHVAVLAAFSTRWLIPRLPAFYAQHPEITINFSTRLTMFDFSAEPFDAAIHVGSGQWPGARVHHLFDEIMIPVATPEYREQLKLYEPRDLGRASLIHQATRPTAWADWFEGAGLQMPNAFRGPRMEQFEMVIQSAAAGLGAALVPLFLAAPELASGSLIVLFDRPLQTPMAYYVVAPEGITASPPLRQFINWLVDEAKGRGQPEAPVAKATQASKAVKPPRRPRPPQPESAKAMKKR